MPQFRCNGWWEQAGYGRQPMQDLLMSFADNKISGSGFDMVGSFRLEGYLKDTRIYLLKQYIGKHQITYFGESLGEGGFQGEWSCNGYVGGNWFIGFAGTDHAPHSERQFEEI